MVKFSKQLEASVVPEWKDAYCNYHELKKDVHRIKEDCLQQINSMPPHSSFGHLRRFGSMSQLHSLGSHLLHTAHEMNPLNRGMDDLRVGHKHKNSIDWNDDTAFMFYETELKEPLGHAELDEIFFNRLDSELEKVNQFYIAKEAEYVARAIRLEKQLLALIEIQEALARQSLKMRTFSLNKSQDHDGDPHSGLLAKGHESSLLEVITVRSDEQLYRWNDKMKEKEYRTEATSEELAPGNSPPDEEMEIIAKFIENVKVTSEALDLGSDENSVKDRVLPKDSCHYSFKNFPWSSRKGSPSSRHEKNSEDSCCRSSVVLERKGDFQARLRQTKETVEHQGALKSKLSGTRSIIQEMIDMSLGKKKVQSFEKMLRIAFIEFYRGLGLLKSYSSLNMVAFANIMKKYDKVGRHGFSPLYIREVEISYFATSDKVVKLMTKIEEIFTKHFADHDRRKAIEQLRPLQQYGGHGITFLLGVFSGTSMALLLGLLVLLSSTVEFRTVGGRKYMDTIFHVFSTLGLLILHMYMYGWNVYAWQRVRINYPFIFEFTPGTELRYREVLLVCSAFTSLLLGTLIAHIIASTKETKQYTTSEFAPLGITLFFLVVLCTPMNVIFKSSRMSFLRCMRRVVLAPFYKVVLADFFLGDQLTSQVASFRNVEFMICYYTGGYFQDRDKDACTHNTVFKVMMYIFSLLPYWFRLMQCLRRWRDERDKKQLYNAGKYAFAMLAMATKVTYSIKVNVIWLVLFILFSCFATLYQLYWDLVVDWGLLQRDSKNRWLRDNLILKNRYIYFLSMGVNAVLRLAWVSSIQHVNMIPGFSQAGWDIIFASLEVIRRGHWNFYRLENEHLNNVGNFRAVKTVPLPFKEFEGVS